MEHLGCEFQDPKIEVITLNHVFFIEIGGRSLNLGPDIGIVKGTSNRSVPEMAIDLAFEMTSLWIQTVSEKVLNLPNYSKSYPKHFSRRYLDPQGLAKSHLQQ